MCEGRLRNAKINVAANGDSAGHALEEASLRVVVDLGHCVAAGHHGKGQASRTYPYGRKIVLLASRSGDAPNVQGAAAVASCGQRT